ncbi:MAG: CdaR family protein [Clostridia bacterium]|nr:CdaR family protein [Clostridia bacterium]
MSYFSNFFQNKKSNVNKKSNIMTKILSVVAAIALWMYVIGEVNPEIIQEIKNVEVKLVNMEKLTQTGLVLMGQDYYSVDIKVRGRRSDIINTTSENINAIADMRGFGQGQNSIPVAVNLPSNLELEDINPLQIKVTIDEIVNRAKPVEIEFEGKAADGYIHTTPIVSLPEISVSGPETFVESVDRIVTRVNLNNSKVDISQSLPFSIVDADNNEVLGVTTEETYIDVSVPILRIKNVPINVKTSGTPAEGYELVSIIHIPSKVDIMGATEVIEPVNSVTANDVSLEGLTETQDINLNVNLPEGAQLAEINQPRIKVFIEKIIEKELIYDVNDLQIQGLREDLEIEFLENNTIKFVVKDIESSINRLSEEDISVMLDLNGIEEGEHSVRVTWQSDKEFKTVDIESGYVNINLTKE